MKGGENLPRVREYGVPPRQKEIEEELYKTYQTRMLEIKDIMDYTGIKKSYAVAHQWLSGVPSVRMCGRKVKYRISDIAKKIYESTVVHE